MTDRQMDGKLSIVNPESRPRPRGFSHGVVAPPGSRLLHVAGQTAAAGDGRVSTADFVAQFDTALANVIEIVRRAGGESHHITRLTIYVTEMDVYLASRSALGPVWKKRMGSHYPAMALVGVAALVDPGAVVEIAADAALPSGEEAR